MAVGYGFFWPGVFALGASVLVVLGGYRGTEVPAVSIVGLFLQIAAGFWAVYTVIAAIRAHHEFSWWKAIATYLLPFVVLLIAVGVFVTLTMSQ
jgi:hypothetical protein